MERVKWRRLLLGLALVQAVLLLFGWLAESGIGQSQPTVLVTGGLGFIGSHVVEELVSRGYRVVILDDESNGHNRPPSPVQAIKGDIIRVDDLAMVPGAPEYIVHLAAAISVAESMKTPAKYRRINVDGSAKVLEWARTRWGTKMVVAASSAAVYGDKAQLPIRETSPYAGLSPYAESKYKMEALMYKWALHGGGGAVALRFFNVYGPRQDPKSEYSGVISKFMQAAQQTAGGAAEIKIFGDGKQTRDFVYVKDVARAIRMALVSGRTGFGVYNVCTGQKTSIQQLAETVRTAFAAPGKTITIANLAARSGDIKESVCDPHKIQEALDWKFDYTIQRGLQMTKEWFTSSSLDSGFT